MKSQIIFIALILLLLPLPIFAAGGDLDTGFAATGLSRADDVSAVAVQPADGKILIGGSFGTTSGFLVGQFARLNADGSFDATFNVGGTGSGNGSYQAILALPDGKILIGGNFTTYNGASRRGIARLNANGSLDTTFVPPTTGISSGDSVLGIAVQTDGKIIIVGDFFSYGGVTSPGIARINTNGTLDTSFAVGTGANSTVFGAAIQADGNIVIVGNFTNYNGTAINSVARINGSDGSLDTSFVIGTGAASPIRDVALDAGGGVIIAGAFQLFNGNNAPRIARLTSTGAFDAAFTSNIGAGANAGANNLIVEVKIDTAGMIYAAGFFTAFGGATHNRLARLFPSGAVDANYNPSITGGSGFINDIDLQPDGKAVVAGDFQRLTDNELRYNIARIETDGTNDDTFEAAPGFVTSVAANQILVKPNGKILLVGLFDAAGRFGVNGITQLNEDGTVDVSFAANQANGGATGGFGEITSVALQTDGKILIGGAFTNYDGTAINRLARLNADGTLDNTFTVGTGASGTVRTIAVQTDGKILIGGDFTLYNGTTRNRFARLETDGTLDLTFITPTFTSTVNDIAVQSDGRILVGGAFTNFDASGINSFARLETNGTRDLNFNVGGTGANAAVSTITLEADGRILIGGLFGAYNAVQHNGIARVNADGSDAAFTGSLTGTSADVRSIAIQADGKIVIGGNFSSCGGVSLQNVCRLNPDGTRDSAFNMSGGGTNARINTVALQADGKILIGGAFTTYKTATRLGVARLQFGDLAVWNGSVSSNWNTAANWTPAQVPSAAIAIVIPATLLPFEPTLDSSRTLLSLTVQTGRTVTVPAGLTLTTPVLVNDGTLTGAGTFVFSNLTRNNGTISVAAAQTSGTGTKRIEGTGAFVNNIFSVVGGATLQLNNDYQFSTLKNVSGAIQISSSTLRLSGAGDALDASSVSSNFNCAGCTIEYNGTAAQTVQAVPNALGYDFIIFNNPAGVTLTETIVVGNGAALIDGTVNVGAFELQILQGATLARTNGYVIGKIAKRFASGGENFTFHTGTANGYSPVEFNATINSATNNLVTVQTFQTNQPNLPAATALARYWQITAESNIAAADLVFNYLPIDVVGGDESFFRIVRVRAGVPVNFPNNCGGGSPCVDTVANTATINNVTEFSDWTLARILPTAASVGLSGRVTANRRGVSRAAVTLVNPATGASLSAQTNSFGFYRFNQITVGQNYVIGVTHQQYRFEPRVVYVADEMKNINFTFNQKQNLSPSIVKTLLE